MTYALGYLAIAAVTGGLAWHITATDRNSRHLDVRLGAYFAIGVSAVAWPLIWGAWAVISARKRWAR